MITKGVYLILIYLDQSIMANRAEFDGPKNVYSIDLFSLECRWYNAKYIWSCNTGTNFTIHYPFMLSHVPYSFGKLLTVIAQVISWPRHKIMYNISPPNSSKSARVYKMLCVKMSRLFFVVFFRIFVLSLYGILYAESCPRNNSSWVRSVR